MNISEVKVKLLGSDILSIIKEFVKIEGLNLKNASIEDGIILEGSFKKGINIDFFIKVEIIECINNKIIARLVNVKILNVKFFRMLRSFVLRQLAKVLKKYGIDSEKDKVIIDVNKILKDVPYVDLKIDEIYMKRAEIWVEASDIKVSIAGGLIKKIESEEVDEEKEVEADIASLELINKVNDNYSMGRKKIESKLSDNTKKYKEYLFLLPDIISLFYRLLKDKRVSIKTKLIMSAGIAYITSPVNMIPNSIPFIGVVDDIGVVFFVVDKIIKDIPLHIIVENWEGKNDILLLLKKGIEYSINFTSAANIEKLYNAIEELATL